MFNMESTVMHRLPVYATIITVAIVTWSARYCTRASASSYSALLRILSQSVRNLQASPSPSPKSYTTTTSSLTSSISTITTATPAPKVLTETTAVYTTETWTTSSFLVSTYASTVNTTKADVYVMESKPIADLTGTDYIERLIYRLQRTRSWTLGIPQGENCTYRGPRCNMGLFCKSSGVQLGCASGCTCQPLQLQHIIDVVNEINAPLTASKASGAVCDPAKSTQCGDGLECKDSGTQQYFCVQDAKMTSSTRVVRNYAVSQQLHYLYSISLSLLAEEKATELVTESFEKSMLNAGEYNPRSVAVLIERIRSWSVSLPEEKRKILWDMLARLENNTTQTS